jgi:hypothetical protein
MADQRLERIANKLSSLNADWQLMEERLIKRMEEMMAAHYIQFQQPRAKDPSHYTSSSQVISLSPSPIENRPGKQPIKETPPSPTPLENLPETQPTKENPTPPPYNDPQPTTTQKTTPITIPTIAEPQASHQPHLFAAPPPNTRNIINTHTASPTWIKSSPPKIPPKNPSKPTNHDANPHSHFFGLCRNTPSLDVALLSGARGKKRRAYDWFRRRKRARYKPSCVAGGRNATKIKGELAEFLALGVTVSGRGKEDQGSGKGGPKRLRKGLRRNTRRSLKPANRRWVARQRLGEPTETGPWPRASSPGRRQRTGAGKMGGAPTVPTAQGSSPGDFSGHQRPPRRPPDGNYAKDGDSGSPEFSIQHRDEPPRDSATDADIQADDQQFPVSKVDRGACSGLTGGGRLKIAL